MFPATVATGDAFCNREKHRAHIKDFITANRHMVIVAPRRYGKTSLIYQVLQETKLPSAIMDLTLCVTHNDLERVVLDHIGKLLMRVLPKTKQAQQAIWKLFSWLNPEVIFSKAGQSIAFRVQPKVEHSPELLVDALRGLDEAAGRNHQHLVLVFDEFQQLASIKEANLEATIRSAMQVSKHITYLFSGSDRHLLEMMFRAKDRPFYNACEIIRLDKIDRADYFPFIRKVFLKKWKNVPLDALIDHILDVSECYPYYVNHICGYFYATNIRPTKEKIDTYWHEYVASNGAIIRGQLLALSGNQRKVLKGLLEHPTKSPSGIAFCRAVDLSEVSSRQSVKKLRELDYVSVNAEGYYQILDPAMRYYLDRFL